jgi:hypothetical protein
MPLANPQAQPMAIGGRSPGEIRSEDFTPVTLKTVFDDIFRHGSKVLFPHAAALTFFAPEIMATPNEGEAAASMFARRSSSPLGSPEDTPEVNVSEIGLQGAAVYRVNGLIDDCGKLVAEGKAKVGWFDVSTLKEPYRIEGKKTMGFELAEQLGWTVPDIIFYPTGGGTGLIGMWKAFAELEAIGFIGHRRPRMVASFSRNCSRSRAYRGWRSAGRTDRFLQRISSVIWAWK